MSVPFVLAVALLVALGVVSLLLGRARRRGEAALTIRANEAHFRTLVHESPDATLLVDRDGVIRSATAAARAIFGRSPASLQGEPLLALLHPDDAARALHTLAEATPAHSTAEWRVRGASSGWTWTENVVTDLTHETAVSALVVTVRDISERRFAESRLTHQAYHDPLTRLANRALFLNRVGHALARAPRRQRPSAVLFLDLDDFKKVNDSLGHGAGDELLLACAGRLSTCVRPGDTIARLGGDEFAVLLEELEDMGHAVQIAERISTALSTPFRMQGRDVFIGVSIGISALGPAEGADEVLRNADLAMYHAKGREKGRWAIYAPEMHAQVLDRLELEADLRAAVAAGDIDVEYQPIVELESGEMVGAEALVRWRHPSRGHVIPSQLVAIAEETGLIVPIGRRVLQEACARCREWQRQNRGKRPWRVAVNLSGRHFQEPSLLEDVRSALDATGLEPALLTLEITESVLMQRSDATLATLRELKALGLRLAIDDFGTGYSSLGYLQRFPIDVLKIDRTFVEAVGARGADPILARAIVALGRTLGIETIAEGIERSEQRDGLRAMGCTLGQGFLFARSMAATALEERMLEPRELDTARAADSERAPPVRRLRATRG